MNLEFEGIAKSKASDRAGIKVEPIAGLWFTIDLDNPRMQTEAWTEAA
jgi:hypothetical protein